MPGALLCKKLASGSHTSFYPQLPIATMIAPDKVFLKWFLPLAVACFLSGPLAVLHSFGLVEHFVGQLALPYRVDSAEYAFSSAWSNGDVSSKGPSSGADNMPDEVPLLFQMDGYPSSGRKTIQVLDKRLVNLTRTHNATLSLDGQSVGTLFLGYIPISETQKMRDSGTQSLPEGDLIQVHKVSSCTDGNVTTAAGFERTAESECTVSLETERKQRFRLKTVRKHDASGLLYGRVEWIDARG